MIPVKLPKEVLSLFPMWEYRCPCCSTYVESNKSFCPNCKTPFDEKRWRVPPRFLKSHEAMSKYAHKVLAPKLTPKQRELLFQHFTELFKHGFEGGDFGEDPETGDSWTGTYTDSGETATVETTSPHHGTYHARFTTDGSAAYENAYCYKNLDEEPIVYARGYFKIDYTAGDKAIFLTFIGNYYDIAYASISGEPSKLYLNYLSGSDLLSVEASALPADNNWFCLELYVNVDNSAGEVALYLDGVEVASVSGLDNDFRGNVDNVMFGLRQCGYNLQRTLDIDCVVVADTYIGPETAGQTYTKTWATNVLFKKLGIPKSLGVDTAFQKQDIPKTFGIDADFLKNDIIKSFTLDVRFGALMTHTISRQIDALLKKLDLTKNFGLDVYFGPFEAETYAKAFALDAVFAYKVRLPELWLDENGKIVLNVSKPYTWVGT